MLVDLIVSGDPYKNISEEIIYYNKLCSPLLRLLNMRCFSVKINKILIPGKYES